MSKDLEFAAKAAGLTIRSDRFGAWRCEADGSPICQWRPRDDNGDALRLGAAIGMNLYMNKQYVVAEIISDSEAPAISAKELCSGDTLAAARRAITRAAAEIGRLMK